MSRRNGLGKFVAGALVGAGLGVLLAPKSGAETRKDLKNKWDELVKKVKELDAEEVKQSLLDKIEEIKKEVSELDREKVVEIAKKKAEKYHICLDERSQGHPLPYTDRQIAKLLDLMNKFPTVENIVDSYDKLCVRDNYGRYDFLPRGTVFDNVIIDHAPGYIYVLCASVYSACPCIYNIQHGTLEEPDYIKDENGVIVMENGELQMRNKETYQKRYSTFLKIAHSSVLSQLHGYNLSWNF